MAQQGKTSYLSPSELALIEVNGPTPTNFHAAGQGHNSPGQQPWNKTKKTQGKFEWITKNFLFPFPFSAPLQITVALPNNFLHKPKRWLCLQNFYLRKHAMTFYIITTLFHREKGGKKKRKRGGKAKKKILPHNIFKQVTLLLFAQKWAFHWNIFYVASFALFLKFFFYFFIFWDIWHQSRRPGLALQLCFEPLPSSDYPTPPSFFVHVCLFFVNAISIKSLLNSSFFGGGGGREGKQSGDFPAAAPWRGRPCGSGITGARGTRLANWSNQ